MNIAQMLLRVPVPESVQNPVLKKEAVVKKTAGIKRGCVLERYRNAMLGQPPMTPAEIAKIMNITRSSDALKKLAKKYGCVKVVCQKRGENNKPYDAWQWVE